MKENKQQPFEEYAKWTAWNWFLKRTRITKVLILTPFILLGGFYLLINLEVMDNPFKKPGKNSDVNLNINIQNKEMPLNENIIYEDNVNTEVIAENNNNEVVVSPKKIKDNPTNKVSPTELSKANVESLPRIFITSDFLINNEQGINNETYKSGDQLKIEYSLEHKCYLIAVSMDQDTIRGALPGGDLTPQLNNVKKFFVKAKIDNEPGYEVYYLIASHKPFSYSLIEPMLKRKQNDFNSKGVDYGEFELNDLPNGFYHDVISFFHK